MNTYQWSVILVILVIICFLVHDSLGDFAGTRYIYYRMRPKLRRKKELIEKLEQQESVLRQKKEMELEDKRRIYHDMESEVKKMFHIELGWVSSSNLQSENVQDKMVRIVNLLAHQLAVACMNEDKESRGEKVELCRDIPGNLWQVEVVRLKVAWSKRRQLVLKIAPELVNRMPHFSKFEPLKSYNAEHLLKKKAKRDAAVT